MFNFESLGIRQLEHGFENGDVAGSMLTNRDPLSFGLWRLSLTAKGDIFKDLGHGVMAFRA